MTIHIGRVSYILFLIFFVSCEGKILFQLESDNSSVALTNKVLFGVNSLSGGSENFGNSMFNQCSALAVDEIGNTYCAGMVLGNIEPGATTDHGGDAFIIKIGPTGDLVWITQLDSSKPEINDAQGFDACRSVEVDSLGNVYCGGEAGSDLGETNGSGSSKDAFVVKLASDGSITWIRHFGQSTASSSVHINDLSGDEVCNDIALDDAGNIYCGGSSDGDFAEVNGGGKDIIVTKLNSNGDILWATQLGGTTLSSGESSGNDSCDSLDIDNSGNIYCGGYTEGNLNETLSGTYDAVVVKVDNSGGIDWISQLGAATEISRGEDYSEGENCGALSVAKDGNSIYCASETEAGTSDINAGGRDLFAFNIDTSTGVINWVSHLGETHEQNNPGNDYSGNELCTSKGIGAVHGGISDVDANGNFYVACESYSSLVETNSGGLDLFVTKFSPTGNIDWIKQFSDSYSGTNGSIYSSGLKVYKDKLIISGFSISQDFLGNISNNTSAHDPFILIMNKDGTY